MAGRSIVVLGGGLGGLGAANQLRRALPAEHRVIVVEKKSTVYMCSFNMRLMAGEIRDQRDGERELSRLAAKGIEWVHGEVLEIDPKARRVRTTKGTLEADYLVIALGADKDGTGVPGLGEGAHNLYDPAGAARAYTAVTNLDAGRAVVLVSRTPFSCPAAPYEAALLMDSAFRSKGNRQKVEVAIYTPEPRPMPSAGPEMGEAVLGMLKERGIEYHPQQRVQKIDAAGRKLVFEQGEASFDLLLGIPPHAAPKVVRDAGLTDQTGWVPVDIETLETEHPGVFAIGDVTSIRQPNPTGMFLPKAWVFADEQSRIVARNISTQIDREEKGARFQGKGFCYLETGNGLAAYGSGNFYAYPSARVYLEPPSVAHHEERKKVELEQLDSLV